MYRKIRSCTGKILTKSKLKYCVVRHRYGKPESQLQSVLIHLRNPGVVKWRCNKIELAHQGQGVADGVFNTGQKGSSYRSHEHQHPEFPGPTAKESPYSDTR